MSCSSIPYSASLNSETSVCEGTLASHQVGEARGDHKQQEQTPGWELGMFPAAQLTLSLGSLLSRFRMLMDLSRGLFRAEAFRMEFRHLRHIVYMILEYPLRQK